MLRSCMLLAAILSISSGCDGVVRTTASIKGSPVYNSGEFGYAAGGRDLRVVIVGNPFGGDQSALDRSVTNAMQGRNFGQETNFTTTPGPSAREMYRVVIVFDPPIGIGGDTVCSTDPATLPPTAGGGEAVVLAAAFCRSERALTSVRGDIGRAAGPEDPAFVALIEQVTRDLFPPKQRKRKRD